MFMTRIKLSSILFIFCFMTISCCNIFLYFLSLAIPRMSTIFVYIQLFVFHQYIKKQNIFILISFVYFCSYLYFYNMVSESILARLLDLSGHPLSGRYWTTLAYKFHTQVEKSRREGSVLEIPHRLKMRPFNSL